MGELHAEVVPGDVHEGVRGRHNAHAVVAPQDVHHKAVPEGGPHLRMHTESWPVSSMASCNGDHICTCMQHINRWILWDWRWHNVPSMVADDLFLTPRGQSAGCFHREDE